MDIRELTIAQAHAAFRVGALTAQALTEAYLARIAALDQAGPAINATMALSPAAVADAAALDKSFAETGVFSGPLHGIPVLIKDQADTAGLTTTYGSAVAKTNVPTRDATVVTRLKAAGAVVLGKTTMAEWAAAWFSMNGATDYAPTRNPYGLDHDVGASSGGSGAAVSANFCLVAVGEDTGGSIRVPSSFCGIVGLRPTPGLVSRAGFCPLLRRHDTPGPMARTVVDCARLLDVLAGFDPEDDMTGVAATAAALGRGGYATGLDDEGAALQRIKSSRIGVLRSRFGSTPESTPVNTVVDTALTALAAAGATLVDVDLGPGPALDADLAFAQTYLVCSRSEIRAFLATKPHLPPDLASFVRPVPDPPHLDLLAGLAHGPADAAAALADPTLAARLQTRDAIQRRVECLLASQHLDALAFPDVRIPPPRHADAYNGRFTDAHPFPTNTFLASMACLPAVTVPAGFTGATEGAAGGLPVGLELVGLALTEQKLFGLARGVEVVVRGRRAPGI